MRLPGSVTIEALNYLHHVDLYEMYAEMITTDTTTQHPTYDEYGVMVGRRDDQHYDYRLREIKYKYSNALVMQEKIPAVYSDVMGDLSLSAKFKNQTSMKQFIQDCIRRTNNESPVF